LDEKIMKDILIGIGFYSPQDYETLRTISVDADKLCKTYDEWLTGINETAAQLKQQGVEVKFIAVNPPELQAWCNKHSRPVDGAARAQFISEKTNAAHE
jgi:hypothetical protein